MASNYWQSSHRRRWIFSEADLVDAHKRRCGSLSETEAAALDDHLLRVMRQVGRELGWRAKVVATASLLFKRFYTQASLDAFDPRLITVTCLYLAAKIEELGQYSMRRLLARGVKEVVNKNKYEFPDFSAQHVHDYEFHILDKLGFDLVMFHPYRPLAQYFKDARVDDNVKQAAWGIVNDSYRTDVMLLYPPYMVALGALFIATVHLGSGEREWFNRLNVSLDELREVVRYIMDHYMDRQENRDKYEESLRRVLAQLARKFRGAFEQQQAEHEERKRKLEKERKLEEERKRKKTKR